MKTADPGARAGGAQTCGNPYFEEGKEGGVARPGRGGRGRSARERRRWEPGLQRLLGQIQCFGRYYKNKGHLIKGLGGRVNLIYIWKD